jgi:hypothetical protein
LKGLYKPKVYTGSFVWTLAEVFIDQKRINLCTHTVKMTPLQIHYFLLIEKDLREYRNVIVKFPCTFCGFHPHIF